MAVDKATLYLIAACVLGVIIYCYRRWVAPVVSQYAEDDDAVDNPNNIRRVRRALRRRAGGRVAAAVSDSESEDEGRARRVGHLGKKKQQAREQKEARRRQREHELAVWESKQKREKLVREYNATVEDEKEKEAAQKSAEEKRRVSESEGKKPLVRDTSFNAAHITATEHQLLSRMVTHISEVGITKCSELQRTLDLEKEADARDRLDYLVSRGAVQGFIDDQGTFVTFDETMLQTLAATINETGRISTSALADLMHTLAMTSQSVRIKSTSAGHDVDEHSACAADHFTHDATTTPSADRHSAHTREES